MHIPSRIKYSRTKQKDRFTLLYMPRKLKEKSLFIDSSPRRAHLYFLFENIYLKTELVSQVQRFGFGISTPPHSYFSWRTGYFLSSFNSCWSIMLSNDSVINEWSNAESVRGSFCRIMERVARNFTDYIEENHEISWQDGRCSDWYSNIETPKYVYVVLQQYQHARWLPSKSTLSRYTMTTGDCEDTCQMICLPDS
jgi:hypothetical protein